MNARGFFNSVNFELIASNLAINFVSFYLENLRNIEIKRKMNVTRETIQSLANTWPLIF